MNNRLKIPLIMVLTVFVFAIMINIIVSLIHTDKKISEINEINANLNTDNTTDESLVNKIIENIEAKESSLLEKEHFLSEDDFTYITKQIIMPYIEKFNGNMQVYFKVMGYDESFSNADINNSIYPASLMKLYMMGEIFNEIEDNRLVYDDVEDLLNAMITQSDNYSYDALLGILMEIDPNTNPFIRLDQFCQKYNFDNTYLFNYYDIGDASFDYLQNYLPGIQFETTVDDLGHFYELLYQGELVSEKASSKMLSLLNQQERTYKIPYNLLEEAITYNKTGELDNYNHDSCLIESPNYDYVLIVMSESWDASGSGAFAIQEMSEDIYLYLNPRNS